MTDSATAPMPTVREKPWMALALLVCSAALAVLVVLLSRENLRLKQTLSRSAIAPIALGDDPPRAGERFVPPRVTDLSGESRALSPGTRPTLLFLANPDCHSCEEERPQWEQFLGKAGARTFDAYVILLDAQASPPAEWLDFSAADVLLCSDDGGTLKKVPQTPAILLLDLGGRVHDVWIGRFARYRDEILYRISLLNETTPQR